MSLFRKISLCVLCFSIISSPLLELNAKQHHHKKTAVHHQKKTSSKQASKKNSYSKKHHSSQNQRGRQQQYRKTAAPSNKKASSRNQTKKNHASKTNHGTRNQSGREQAGRIGRQQAQPTRVNVSAKNYENHWYQSTFPTNKDSIKYHTQKHGNGRQPLQYTRDAVNFYQKYKNERFPVTLKDGSPGYKIKKGSKGGTWTKDGKVVTFWG